MPGFHIGNRGFAPVAFGKPSRQNLSFDGHSRFDGHRVADGYRLLFVLVDFDLFIGSDGDVVSGGRSYPERRRAEESAIFFSLRRLLKIFLMDDNFGFAGKDKDPVAFVILKSFRF